jgi:hypothetical protein
VTWSESENIKWKVEIPGKGHSSPVIWGHKVFLQTAIDTGQAKSTDGQPAQPAARAAGRVSARPPQDGPQVRLVQDRTTGKTLWQKTATEAVPHEGHQPTGTFANYSPVTDGKYIWVSFGSRGLHCFDLDGNLKWSQPLPTLRTIMGFGEGSSPALAGDAIIVVCDQEAGSAIFAFDKVTGEQLWRQDRDERTSWATPAVAEVDGKTQVIVSATKLTRSYDAKTGELIWQYAGQVRNVIPSPVVGFGMVFCTSGYQGSSLQAIKLAGSKGDLSGTDAVVWQVNKGRLRLLPAALRQSIYVFRPHAEAVLLRSPDWEGFVHRADVGGNQPGLRVACRCGGPRVLSRPQRRDRRDQKRRHLRGPGDQQARRRSRRQPRRHRRRDVPAREQVPVLHRQEVTP